MTADHGLHSVHVNRLPDERATPEAAAQMDKLVTRINRIESDPHLTPAEPLDEPRFRYPVSDREAWEIANQHELQKDLKW